MKQKIEVSINELNNKMKDAPSAEAMYTALYEALEKMYWEGRRDATNPEVPAQPGQGSKL